MQSETPGNGAAEWSAAPEIDENLAKWLGIERDAATFTVKLAKPYELAGQIYRELTLSEPSLGQVEEAAKKTGLAQDVALISAVAGVPERVVRALPHSEYRRAIAFLNVFLLAGPQPALLPG